ncbi:hypothetical protein GBAR_LOCUS12007 [Geodia barretti]|uniref:Uncharacterized protein n=1 Tax=Geodia barretti TaxID=519541 RepID=A0AA35RZM9_GEOBA|nr:hypothetical protein GBAR_LOCUS12007 [Geodia barretti]
MVNDYTPDTTSPKVNGFELNINDGTLVLSFSEAVDQNATDVTQIRIQNGEDHTSLYVQLQGGEIETNDINTIFTIHLEEDDLNSIKEETDLGTTASNTYLALTSETASDFSGNQIEEIPLISALPAQDHTIDMTPPTLEDFEFDMNSGIFMLTFSEAVKGSSLLSERLMLQSSAASIPGEVHTLSSTDSHSNENSIIVSLTVTDGDLNAIKALPNIATSRNTTYLRVLVGAISDTSDQLIATLPDGQAVPAGNFTP